MPNMGMSPMPVSTCCEMVNPCVALCQLLQMELDLALGKRVRAYEIGEEKFTIQVPTLAEIRSLIVTYRGLCNQAQGKPSRQRGSGCFVFGPHRCRSCSSSPCRCR